MMPRVLGANRVCLAYAADRERHAAPISIGKQPAPMRPKRQVAVGIILRNRSWRRNVWNRS